MFYIPLGIGLYGAGILILGLVHTLRPNVLLIYNLMWCSVSIVLLLKNKLAFSKGVKEYITTSRLNAVLASIMISFLGTYLIAALAPETMFDALWYHLTLPKLYLQHQSIPFFEGNLYMYSAMPRLTEMVYTGILAIGGATGVKIINFTFMVIITVMIIRFSRNWLSQSFALGAGLIFVSDLAVGWLAGTAGADLLRTLFELAAFISWYSWYKSGRVGDLIKAGIMIGFAIGTKLFSIPVFMALTVMSLNKTKGRISPILSFVIPGIGVSLYWFINAFLKTGNPVYPVFSHYLNNLIDTRIPPLWHLPWDIVSLSLFPSDWIAPISPLHLAFLPLGLFLIKIKGNLRLFYGYLGLLMVGWALIPRTGGSRFFVPILPLMSVATAWVVQSLLKRYSVAFNVVVISLISATLLVNLVISAYVNQKAFAYVSGKQTKEEYLMANLDLSHAFFDIDGEIAKLVPDNETVLIIGGHNLFYVPFDYDHVSYAPQKNYTYIMAQYQPLPEQYDNYALLYTNPRTKVSLYKQR